MQRFLFPILSFTVLIACKSEPDTVNKPEQIVEEERQLTNPDEQLLMTDSLFETNINSFPKHWVEIEVKLKELVYTDYCDTDHPYLKLIEGDSCWQIETFYGHDGELWNVLNMTANVQNAENQVLQEGIFVVTKETFPDNEIYEVSYFWNQTARFCTFGDFFNQETEFADFDQYDSFTIKKEKCK